MRRRYVVASEAAGGGEECAHKGGSRDTTAGAYTRPLFGSTSALSVG